MYVMTPLAVSGPTVIGAAVALALALTWYALRGETRDERRREEEAERSEHER